MRRFAVLSAILVLLLVAIFLAAPWWLGSILPRVGEPFGATFKTYERLGYSRFRIKGFEYRRESVRVTVESVEADTPLLWLWGRWTSTPGPVLAGAWKTEVVASTSTKTTDRSNFGWMKLQRVLQRIARPLTRWVPEARVGSGIVTWPGQTLTFASAEWKNGTISTPDMAFRNLHASASGQFLPNGVIDGRVVTLDGSGRINVRAEGRTVTAAVVWWEQAAHFNARFAEEGWLPGEARLTAENWEVPASRVKLGGNYAFVRGGGTAEWRDNKLLTKIDVEAQPMERTPAPPLKVKLQGQISPARFIAEVLEVSLPGVEARLSAPVALDRNGQLRSPPSTFTITADLARQPWFPAAGKLTGSGSISADGNGNALIRFDAGGDDISVAETSISRLRATGELVWPLLEFQTIQLTSPDGSDFTARGGWDLTKREVRDASLQGRINRASLSRWLPAYPQFNTINLSLNAQGPWGQMVHQGRADVTDLLFPKTHPLAVDLTWKGQGPVIEEFVGRVLAGDTKVEVAGNLDGRRLILTSLLFANGDVVRLKSANSAELRWGERWSLQGLNLTGPDALLKAELDWGKTGQVQLHAARFDTEWLRALLIFPATRMKLEQFDLDAHWTDGPAEFTTTAAVTLELGYNRAAQVLAQASGSAQGLEIASLRVVEGGAEIASSRGHLPLVITPGTERKWEVRSDQAFTLDATTSPNPAFWDEINRLSGINVVKPEARIHFEGSLNQPRGDARFSAAEIIPLEGRYKGVWPKMEDIAIHLVGGKGGVTLKQFEVAIEGQAVRASGRIGVNDAEWTKFIENPMSFAERGEIHLEIPEAEIAPFVRYFPAYIAPKGRFQVDLVLDGEKAVAGFIRLQDGASRPLGPLGVLQEINADIRFSGRTANFQAVTARMAGQLVTLRGTAELPARKAPQLDLSLKGENLPFIRRAGLLVRGDLDLKLTTPNASAPLIRGVVKLRDSLFLADIRSLLPGGTRGVAGRPPYFSVDTPPLNTWNLEVAIEGEKFLRLRTPVFNGLATARFKLDGTLGEPRIAGEAMVDQGAIRLPFANFTVKQGEVRLSVGQVEPQIWLAATTRRFGYDVRMELTGNTSAPNLTFTSSPPLEAEQVLLMVMAGDAPRNEVSTTDRQRVARFGAFFGQSLLGSLGGDSSSAERLTISSGADISEQGRETYDIEYKLGDRWSLTGEYDEFDDYYGGLKWRIYPKSETRPDDKK